MRPSLHHAKLTGRNSEDHEYMRPLDDQNPTVVPSHALTFPEHAAKRWQTYMYAGNMELRQHGA